ncbi:MAG: hypothetical protein AWU59_1897 [Methanolobus sp. T82-4]|nr:MAG: hypothetical protein AWU59_1897 [Methanolobus sp. T82-4]
MRNNSGFGIKIFYTIFLYLVLLLLAGTLTVSFNGF